MVYKRLSPNRYFPAGTVKTMGTASCELFPPTINLLVWNMFKAKKSAWQADFNTLCEDKNLVLLQESIFNSQYDAIFADSIEMRWLMANSFTDRLTGVDHGIKTGAVVAPTSYAFWSSEDSEPIYNTKKMILATQYPLQGADLNLLVVNMHAINFVPIQKYTRHLLQVSEAITSHRGPLILAGDFNTWSKKRYDIFCQLAYQFQLAEAVMLRKPRLAHLRQNIDHVFYRGLTLVQASVLTNIKSSDHYPIYAQFIVK